MLSHKTHSAVLLLSWRYVVVLWRDGKQQLCHGAVGFVEWGCQWPSTVARVTATTLWSQIQSRSKWVAWLGLSPCFWMECPVSPCRCTTLWTVVFDHTHSQGVWTSLCLPSVLAFSRGSGVHFGGSCHQDCHSNKEWNTVIGGVWMALKSSIWVLFSTWNSEKMRDVQTCTEMLLSYHSL